MKKIALLTLLFSSCLNYNSNDTKNLSTFDKIISQNPNILTDTLLLRTGKIFYFDNPNIHTSDTTIIIDVQTKFSDFKKEFPGSTINENLLVDSTIGEHFSFNHLPKIDKVIFDSLQYPTPTFERFYIAFYKPYLNDSFYVIPILKQSSKRSGKVEAFYYLNSGKDYIFLKKEIWITI